MNKANFSISLATLLGLINSKSIFLFPIALNRLSKSSVDFCSFLNSAGKSPSRYTLINNLSSKLLIIVVDALAKEYFLSAVKSTFQLIKLLSIFINNTSTISKAVDMYLLAFIMIFFQ